MSTASTPASRLGWPSPNRFRAAIAAATGWVPALDADGEIRDGAEICEITGPVPAEAYPAGTRFIVRREHPHPGAQLSMFDTIEGMRHQVMATDTHQEPGPSNTWRTATEATHRLARTRVDGIDLLAWTQLLLLDGELAKAEPKKLRYRLLHVAARITRSARRTQLRIAEVWPWPPTWSPQDRIGH